MKKLFASFALAAAMTAPTLSALAADTYVIDGHHTFPMFEVSHLGFSIQRGRFDKTSGTVMLDAATKTGSIDLLVDVTSLDMGFPLWNQHVSEGFFNTEKFPTMTFKSNKLIFDGNKLVGADGQFTLLGVTKPLTLVINNFKCGTNPMSQKELCGAEISATLKRSDFGMTKYVPMIGDEVKIFSAVEAYKQ